MQVHCKLTIPGVPNLRANYTREIRIPFPWVLSARRLGVPRISHSFIDCNYVLDRAEKIVISFPLS